MKKITAKISKKTHIKKIKPVKQESSSITGIGCIPKQDP